MDFTLDDDQTLLLDSTRRMLEHTCGFEARCATLRSEAGWSRAAWSAFAELGLLGLALPEAAGGLGVDRHAVMAVAGAVGQALALEPFHSSALVATRAIHVLASREQCDAWLPALIDGRLIAVVAHDEPGATIDVRRCSTSADAVPGGWRLSGSKFAIYHAPIADLLLVSARDADGVIGLFALQPDADGVRMESFTTVDGQRAADIVLQRAVATARLGGDAAPALQAAVDFGTAALCADALGVIERMHRATVEYTRNRTQFGVPIGRFQALQHRMADMQIELEQARSMALFAAAHCEDTDADARRAAVSAAKARIGQAARFVAQQAVQLHGGMGMTDELDVSHGFRRLLAFELRGGTTDEHLDACVRRLQAA